MRPIERRSSTTATHGNAMGRGSADFVHADLRVVREPSPIQFEDGRFAAPTPHSLDT